MEIHQYMLLGLPDFGNGEILPRLGDHPFARSVLEPAQVRIPFQYADLAILASMAGGFP